MPSKWKTYKTWIWSCRPTTSSMWSLWSARCGISATMWPFDFVGYRYVEPGRYRLHLNPPQLMPEKNIPQINQDLDFKVVVAVLSKNLVWIVFLFVLGVTSAFLLIRYTTVFVPNPSYSLLPTRMPKKTSWTKA